jgi:hypothetical protein
LVVAALARAAAQLTEQKEVIVFFQLSLQKAADTVGILAAAADQAAEIQEVLPMPVMVIIAEPLDQLIAEAGEARVLRGVMAVLALLGEVPVALLLLLLFLVLL